MNYKFVCGRTPQEQTTEQALRRLKYLHTPLVQLGGGAARQRRRKHDQNLKATSLQTSYEDAITPVKRSPPEKRFVVSLQPKSSNKSKDIFVAGRRLVKCNQDRKSIRTGRAPLNVTRAYCLPSCTSQQTNSNALNEVSITSVSSANNPNCVSKFTPIGGVYYDTVNFFTCPQCVSKKSKRPHTKMASRKYLTNMNINRIAFSARPCQLKREQFHEAHHAKSAEDTKGSLLRNGWGARRKHRCFLSGNSAEKETLNLTLGLQTLKLDPKREKNQEILTTDNSPPEPPPTPISQIDIKLPNRVVVKYNLRDDVGSKHTARSDLNARTTL